ncbi:MAG: GMC oxidoreductase [Bacteroidota bacterium]
MEAKYDIILVGTGFASSFFLKKVLDCVQEEIRILVLERGRLLNHSEQMTQQQEIEGPTRLIGDASNTYINQTPHKRWNTKNIFGGGSNCWWGCTPRPMPNDFKLKSLYDIGEDWPISYSDLEEYYCEAESIMNIAGPDQTPYPMSQPYPLPPHEQTTVDKILKNEYGDLYISQPTARASQSVSSRPRCCSNGVCTLCPINAKFTILNGLKSIYQDQRVNVLKNAEVTHLDIEAGSIKGVQYKENGKTQSVNCELLFLGANAIQNPYLMLKSGIQHPLLGKRLNEQVSVNVEVLLDSLDNFSGSTVITANGYNLYDGDHRKERAAALIEGKNILEPRLEAGKWRQLAKFKVIIEDLPSNENYVAEGTEKPIVHYEGFSKYTQNTINALPSLLNDFLSPLPVEDITIGGINSTEAHVQGTVLMGETEEDSIVDENLAHHNIRNLFVGGSAVYPTCMPANPTLTICGLSLRAADKLFN